MQVVNLTTPAQLFHCLRRQVIRPIRKPLIVMTPKSLLRHPKATSALSEFSEGSFQRVIPDARTAELSDAKAVRRVILCSGKLYYDLMQAIESRPEETAGVLVHRVEQLYPLDVERDLMPSFEGIPTDVPVFWVQEEPLNQGAWPSLCLRWGRQLGAYSFDVISRPASASPATGSAASHRIEQERLINEAFGVN